MKTFGNNDTVFARVTMMGREVLNLRLEGIASMAAIISLLKEKLQAHFGLIMLNIRNLTQGWSQVQTYRLA